MVYQFRMLQQQGLRRLSSLEGRVLFSSSLTGSNYSILRQQSSSSSLSSRSRCCRRLLMQQQQCYFSSSEAAAAANATTKSASVDNNPKKNNNNNSHLLYMWGTDSKGSLLKPKERSDEKMVDVPTLIENWREMIGCESRNDIYIQDVVCGPTDTALILSDGRCFVCGENKQGQLGQGHTNPVETLTEIQLPVEDPATTTVKQVSLGMNFAAYVDSVGDLYTAGWGGSAISGYGALGHGDADAYTSPKLVESLVEDGCFVKKVQVGESHMTVLTTEGEVLTTGAGAYGRLGNFDTVDQLYLGPTEILTPESGVTDIAGGKSFTLALTKEGVLYSWGRNHKGQLGTGLGLSVDIYAMQSVPEPIETDELANRKVIKVAAGHSHAACITESGEMFFWGMTLQFEPVRVAELLHTKVADIVCGQDYTLAIDEEGRMYSFGKGKTGVLGQGSAKKLNQAVWMEAFGEDAKIRKASAGWKHAACLVEH